MDNKLQRYMLASVRLNSKINFNNLTDMELSDMFMACPMPEVGFDAWVEKIQVMGDSVAAPPPQAMEMPDKEAMEQHNATVLSALKLANIDYMTIDEGKPDEKEKAS